MRVLKVIFHPRWIVLAIVVAAFTVLCWSVLAPWQLGKNSDTQTRNNLIKASVNAKPVPAAQIFDDAVTVTKKDEWRKVTVTGAYDNSKQVLARLRSIDDQPAYEVLVPFDATDGHTYLVDRGYVRPTSGVAVPDFDPPPIGQVTLEARTRRSEGTVPGKTALRENGYLQVSSIDPKTVGRAVGVTLTPGYLDLTEDQPGGLGLIELPQLDSGPYLSYGLQWTAFGIMAPLGLGYFVYSEVRRRREDRELAGLEGETPFDAPPPTEDQVHAAKMADRYGRTG